ncbi:MAG: glycosyltransferase, partial [Nitriliruptorales bacterium]|nr:glycosyltransferase [Nitriliruptorales bacterium]
MTMVSVVVPTHNRPSLLRTTLVSVLGQDYHDLEVIVVDDDDLKVVVVLAEDAD